MQIADIILTRKIENTPALVKTIGKMTYKV